MKRRYLLFTILKSMAIAVIAGRPVFGQEDLDPVKMMPDTHKLLFENSFVRVVEGRVPAGGMEPKHKHPHNIMVSLVDFASEVRTLPYGKWTPMHRAFGTATWNEAAIHEVRIVGNVASHTIRIELKC